MRGGGRVMTHLGHGRRGDQKDKQYKGISGHQGALQFPVALLAFLPSLYVPCSPTHSGAALLFPYGGPTSCGYASAMIPDGFLNVPQSTIHNIQTSHASFPTGRVNNKFSTAGPCQTTTTTRSSRWSLPVTHNHHHNTTMELIHYQGGLMDHLIYSNTTNNDQKVGCLYIENTASWNK